MLTDIWAHKFIEDPKLLEEIEDSEFDEDDVAAQIGYRPKQEMPDDFEDV